MYYIFNVNCTCDVVQYKILGLPQAQGIFSWSRTLAVNSHRFVDNDMGEKSYVVVMLGQLKENGEVNTTRCLNVLVYS